MIPNAASVAVSLFFSRVKDAPIFEKRTSSFSYSKKRTPTIVRKFQIRWPASRKSRPDTPEQVSSVKLDDFELIKVLGEGALGRIFLVREISSQKIYALKAIRKPEDRYKALDIVTERNILSKIDHPFIVKLYYAFHTKDHAFLVMNYACGGDLFHLINHAPYDQIPEDFVLFYIAEIILALEHLHSRKIVYRDLKAENVLLDAEGHVQLADFGFATLVSRKTNNLCGTPEYVAPEMIMEQPYNETVDFWALGILLFYFLTKNFPFIGKNNNTTLWKILYEEPIMPEDMSSKAAAFCKALLEYDPEQRLGSKKTGGIKKLKSHEFFTEVVGFRWEDIESKKISPPFKPEMENEVDTRNFDDSITNLPPRISDIPSPPSLTIEFYDDIHVFKGFNYTSSAF